MLYEVGQIEKIRGFHALTQNEERLVDKLLKNINEMGGKKASGFLKTRREVLVDEFDLEHLKEVIEICVELHESLGDKKADKFIQNIMKHNFEKIFRDHVPMDMGYVFRKMFAQRYHLNERCVERTARQLARYFTCGQIVSVTESYKQAMEELEEGKVIYVEPTTVATA